MPLESSAYDIVWDWLMPLATALYLLDSADIRQYVRCACANGQNSVHTLQLQACACLVLKLSRSRFRSQTLWLSVLQLDIVFLLKVNWPAESSRRLGPHCLRLQLRLLAPSLEQSSAGCALAHTWAQTAGRWCCCFVFVQLPTGPVPQHGLQQTVSD